MIRREIHTVGHPSQPGEDEKLVLVATETNTVKYLDEEDLHMDVDNNTLFL